MTVEKWTQAERIAFVEALNLPRYQVNLPKTFWTMKERRKSLFPEPKYRSARAPHLMNGWGTQTVRGRKLYDSFSKLNQGGRSRFWRPSRLWKRAHDLYLGDGHLRDR